MLTLQIKEKVIENLTPEEEFIRGTVGAKCQINFDEFWQGYEKYIVFKRVGYEPINIMVDSLENEIEIPYTILAEIGEFKIGVFGITETETLPTLYSKDIKILYGTDTHGTTPPTYTPSEIDQLRLLKQDKLVSGENIKTINGESVLGKGDIKVQAKIEVDQTYAPTSENAQSGKAVSEAVAIEQKRSDNTFANSLKSSKSGSAILIDDVSPVTHEMSVKISSDTVTDLTSVKVFRQGKNLIQTNIIEVTSPTDVEDLIWRGHISGKLSFSLDDSEYTPNSSNVNSANFKFVFGDGTAQYLAAYGQHIYLNTSSPLKEIYFLNWGRGTGVIKNIQLEIGSSETDYEPYVEPTEYTPNADGTVNGVTSLYPNTTLMTDTDGVIITCEYNKDINKFSGVDVYVPTKTSELINDSNFATQDYVDEEIANFDFIKIVTELPETGLVNRTYFVPKQDPATNDLYDEYMWVDGKWELITTKQIEVDLTEYVKHTDINQSYDPTSENAQSGKAVAEAVEPKLDKPSMPPAVGNILKVLSLNEDGTFTTEWADNSNDWVLVAKGEVTEEVVRLKIDKDMNGNDFKLTEFHFRILLLSSTGSAANAIIRINNTGLSGTQSCLLSSANYTNKNYTQVINYDGKEFSTAVGSASAGGIGSLKAWTNALYNYSNSPIVESISVEAINSTSPNIAGGTYELWGRVAK